MKMKMLGNLFGFTGKIIKTLLQRSTNKESCAEQESADTIEAFVVHKPKWMVPVLILCMLVFSGFAFFCWKEKVMSATIFFIAFASVALFAIIWESAFSIKVDGPQITVFKLFGAGKIYYAMDIIACETDNAGSVKVFFESGKISVDGMMVNSNLFYDFAQHHLYLNLSSQRKRVFKIRRKIKELWLMLFCIVVCAAMLSIFIFDRSSFSIKDMVLAFSLFGGIILLCLIYFPVVLSRKIVVDEENECFSYTKGFRRFNANFSQLLEVRTKKRFGESALNYVLTIEQADSKIIRKKFSSLDDNASRFVNILIRYFEDGEEQDNY